MARLYRAEAAIAPEYAVYAVDADTVANFVKISAKFRSFSAVSAPIFASKYAFFSIFQNLPDYLADIFKKLAQNFADFVTFAKILLNFYDCNENC